MIARAERPALIGATVQRAVANVVGLGAIQAAERFGEIDIAINGQMAIDQAGRAGGHQMAELIAIEFVLPAASDAGGNVGEQFADQSFQMRLHFGESQIRADNAHAAINVVADATGRNHAPLLRIGGTDAADAKTVAPMNIGHGQAGDLNAGKRGDIGDLLAGLVGADLLNQQIVGINQAVNAHTGLVAFWNPPAALAGALQRSMKCAGGHECVPNS